MRAKRLFPLVVLLIVLALAAIVFKRPSAPAKLAAEAGFERLLPPPLRAARITGIDLYAGANPEDTVRLRRDDTTWSVLSHYNAPARATKVMALLERLDRLQGELRADQADLLRDFRLEPSQALHLQVYVDNATVPALHLLAGKSQGQHGFMRRNAESRVYSVPLNLHHAAGLYGEIVQQPPQATPWLDLQVQHIPNEHVTAVTLQTPTHHWHFVRQPPSTDRTQVLPGASPAPWQLTQPALSFTVKPERLNALVSTLGALRAEDIVNPAHTATYGLTEALCRAALTVQPPGQESSVATLWVGHAVPEQDGKRYARLGTSGPIYVLPSWPLKHVFPQSKELFELRLVHFSPHDVVRLAWRHNDRVQVLERLDATASATTDELARPWRVVETLQTLPDSQPLQTLLTAVTQMHAEDWFTPPAPPAGDDHPMVRLDLTLAGGQTEVLRLRKHAQLYHATVRDVPGVFVIPAEAVQPVIDTLTTLHAGEISPNVTPATSP